MKRVSKEAKIDLLIHNSAEDRLIVKHIENGGYIVNKIDETHLLSGDSDSSLLIVDQIMAKRHGDAVLAIRKRRQPPYFPMLLAANGEVHSAPWLQAGFDDVIRLPISKDDLLSKLETFLRRRRYAESILDENTERFRATIDLAPVGIVHTDPQCRLLIANRCFCNMLGYSEQELYGVPMQQLLHSEDVEHVQSNITSLLAGHETAARQFVKRYYHKDGKIIWTAATVSLVRDTRANPKYIIGIVEDITSRKRLATALHDSAHFAHSIIDALCKHTRVVDEWSGLQTQNVGNKPSAAVVELPLTARQREVLQNIAQGRSTKEIAHSLGISPKTVDAHRTQIMERLGIRDVPGLVRYAIRIGLVKLE